MLCKSDKPSIFSTILLCTLSLYSEVMRQVMNIATQGNMHVNSNTGPHGR